MRAKRTPETPCWTWTRARDGAGYGTVWRGGRLIGAHRYVYEALIGPIPDGLQLDHLCHDPKTCPGGPACPHRVCVNPDHLEPVTHAENVRRSSAAVLSIEAADSIRAEYASGGVTCKQIGMRHGVSGETIRLLVHNRTWNET